MKSAYLIALTAILSTMNVANAAWQKLPAVKSAPVNLASESIVGTKLVSTSGISNSQSLLADDPALFARLPAGTSSAVIDISEQTIVNFTSFINEYASGVVSIAASTNNNDWVTVSKGNFDSNTRLIELSFAGIQAKYVKISFDLSKSGSISSLKVLGSNKISDYLPQQVKKKGSGSASGIDGTKPVYMFPAPSFYGELENGQASYKFPETTEKYRTVIYDLRDLETIAKFSAAYSRAPTRVEIFAFDHLPEKKDWRGKTTFDPSILETTKPVVVGEDAKGIGYIDINAKPVTARYVVMRFEPNYAKGVAGLNFDLQSVASAALIPFSGIANQLGVLNFSTSNGHPVASGNSSPFIVLNTKMTSGNTQKVYISKAAIAQMQQQMGPGTTEAQAINAILNKAGLESVGGVLSGNGGASNADNNDGPSGEEIADPAMSLSPFTTSGAYRGGGGGIGGGDNTPPRPNNNNNNNNNGSSRPIVIITETVNPASP